MADRKCAECGGALEGRKAVAAFCSGSCRKAWNNRRAMRGAQMYDLFMAIRYDRKAAKEQGLWSLLCRMAQDWKELDAAAGRQTLGSRKDLLERTALRHGSRGRV